MLSLRYAIAFMGVELRSLFDFGGIGDQGYGWWGDRSLT